MTNCWVVLVHPYHDYLIDVAVFDTQDKAEYFAGVIEEAVEQRRQLFLHWETTRIENLAAGVDEGLANAEYGKAVEAHKTKWAPALGERITDGLASIENVDVEEREIR